MAVVKVTLKKIHKNFCSMQIYFTFQKSLHDKRVYKKDFRPFALQEIYVDSH